MEEADAALRPDRAHAPRPHPGARARPADLKARARARRHARGRLPPPHRRQLAAPRRETCAMSVHPPHRQPPRLTAAGRLGQPGPPAARRGSATLCLVELQKLRHDRTELLTRAIQPALWLVIFGETFTRLHAIPTGNVPVPRLPRARHPRPVGAVHRDLLRHPDHLGARRGRARQAAGHADAAGRARHRQGVRGGHAGARAGRRRARARAAARRGADARTRCSWLGVVVVVLLGAAFFSLPVDDDRRAWCCRATG